MCKLYIASVRVIKRLKKKRVGESRLYQSVSARLSHITDNTPGIMRQLSSKPPHGLSGSVGMIQAHGV